MRSHFWVKLCDSKFLLPTGEPIEKSTNISLALAIPIQHMTAKCVGRDRPIVLWQIMEDKMSGMLSLRVVLQFSAKDPPTIRDIQLDFREKEAVDPIDHVSVVLAEAPGESRAEAEFNLLQLLLNRTKSGYPSDRALFAFVAKMFAR